MKLKGIVIGVPLYLQLHAQTERVALEFGDNLEKEDPLSVGVPG